MPNDMSYYVDTVLFGDLTDDGWLAFEKKFDAWAEQLSKTEQEELERSGAVECLHMLCSGIRYELDRQ